MVTSVSNIYDIYYVFNKREQYSLSNPKALHIKPGPNIIFIIKRQEFQNRSTNLI